MKGLKWQEYKKLLYHIGLHRCYGRLDDLETVSADCLIFHTGLSKKFQAHLWIPGSGTLGQLHPSSIELGAVSHRLNVIQTVLYCHAFFQD